MDFEKLVVKRRTIRKYTNEPVEREMLVKLIDYARLAPYGANIQPLKFAIADDANTAERIFAQTKWSAYHPEDAPKASEQPPAYIAILADTTVKKGSCDVELGTAGAYIVLGAADMGLSTCWLGAINKEKIHDILGLPEHLQVLNIIAVGHSEQKSSVEEMKNGDVKYYSGADGSLHVPKRSLNEIIADTKR